MNILQKEKLNPSCPRTARRTNVRSKFEINLANKGEESQHVFLSASLTAESREKLLAFYRNSKTSLRGLNAQMPCLDLKLATHKLNVEEGARPVKQAPQNYRPELEVQIKQEIQKLLDVVSSNLSNTQPTSPI